MERFLEVDADRVHPRQELEQRRTGLGKISTSLDLPLSLECKRILAYAAEEAERLRHSHIETEHLLLGMLREENSVAWQILHGCGLKVETIREELARRPMLPEPDVVYEQRHSLTLSSPDLPQSGVVADADTAMRIAEAIWIPLYDGFTLGGSGTCVVCSDSPNGRTHSFGGSRVTSIKRGPKGSASRPAMPRFRHLEYKEES